jgi:hypothetical protein
MPFDASIEARFWPKVDTDNPSGCWIWTAATNGLGYGVLWLGHDRRGYAHRIAYELFRGPIPDGLDLDHLCRRPSCVYPWHLQAVTHRVNVRRGNAPSARIARSGRCSYGHLRTPTNTRTRDGKTFCRPCQARWAREARQRRAVERSLARGH